MDQNLKNRLTGAIILVSLAVIFIPVILEGPDNEWTPLSQGIPEAPKLDYKAPVRLPRAVEVPAPVVREKKAAGKPVYKLAEPARSKAAQVIPEPAPKPAPEPAPEPQAAPAVSKQASGGAPPGWFVQVGSFSSERNASGLTRRLEAAGFDVNYYRSSAGTGQMYRVLVGPDSSRKQAEKLRERLASEFRFEGIIVNDPG